MPKVHTRGFFIGLAFALAVAAASTASAFLRGQSQATHFDDQVAALEQQLAEAKDPEIIASLREKLAIALESQRQEQDANARPVDRASIDAKQNRTATEVASNDGKGVFEVRGVAAGDGEILEGMQPPVPASQFVGTEGNLWVASQPPGARLMVWAGALGDDPKQGALLLATEGPKLLGIFPASEAHGALTIVGAEGSVLFLLSADGTGSSFDTKARTFK